MFNHILVPVDCTDEMRREAVGISRYVSELEGLRVTLAAAVSPTDDPVLRAKKARHADGALNAVAEIFSRCGIYVCRQTVEGEDPVAAFAKEARAYDAQYDLVVLGAHHSRVEIDEAPCRGSFADRLAQRSTVPILIVPGGF